LPKYLIVGVLTESVDWDASVEQIIKMAMYGRKEGQMVAAVV
jgi:hypothetical protein